MQTNTVAGRWGAVVLFLSLAITLSFLVLSGSGAVEAAKGGNGKGKGHGVTNTDTGNGGGGGASDATISVSPDPLIAYSTMTINGSGFAPGEAVSIRIEQTWCCVWGTVVPDGSGSFSLSTPTRGPGTYKVWATQGNASAYVEVAVIEG